MPSNDPRAGQPADPSTLLNVARLVTAYFAEQPDAHVRDERVTFGTSGHRGSAFKRTFNEAHVLAISQAIAETRAARGIDGPLFVGADTHALSEPALASAIEVLAANGVALRLSAHDAYTPTPAVSHAILAYNRGRSRGLADGIVITPSHNPPEDGGFKYNPPHGGPADSDITGSIERRANALLEASLDGVKRMSLQRALARAETERYDFIASYVADLAQVIDFDRIRAADLHLGAAPLGGASVAYWPAIADRYRLKLDVVDASVDATFRFMTLDWDGRIRMDPSSPDAMASLLAIKTRFDLAFGCDTDADRHGIVTPQGGLMPANHVLSVLAADLLSQRQHWPAHAGLGKTVVSSRMLDHVAHDLKRPLVEVPVGFKWFVAGLSERSLGIAGEESAGATFLSRDGTPWTTDKDGLIACLAAAELMARHGIAPDAYYARLEERFGALAFARADAHATKEQKDRLAKLAPDAVAAKTLLGDPITAVRERALGNGAAIGGLKVMSRHHWFAVRPSGTEDIYKIYAESDQGADILPKLFAEAQAIVDGALAS